MLTSSISSVVSRSPVAALAVAATVGVVTVGCPPDFSPYWKIDKLRVMAIQADPVVVEPMETTTLSAAVWAPDDQPIDYDWSWCPLQTSADDNHECPVDASDFEEFSSDDADGADNDVEVPDEELFDLGDDEEATFFNFFDAEQVREFCEAIQREFIEEVDDDELADLVPGGDCEEGYEISVRLEVSTDDDSIVATKGFRLWAGGDEANENPEIDDFQVRPDDADDLESLVDRAGWEVEAGADRDDQWVSVPEDEDFETLEDIPLEFRTLVDPDSLQTYTTDADDEPRQEGLVYRHFWTGGGLSASRHIYGPDFNTLETASNAVQTMELEEAEEGCPESTEEGCRLRVWSVVRDDRLGLDWVDRQFVVHDGEGG